jgi:hypothetical protein
MSYRMVELEDGRIVAMIPDEDIIPVKTIAPEKTDAELTNVDGCRIGRISIIFDRNHKIVTMGEFDIVRNSVTGKVMGVAFDWDHAPRV